MWIVKVMMFLVYYLQTSTIETRIVPLKQMSETDARCLAKYTQAASRDRRQVLHEKKLAAWQTSVSSITII